MIVLAAVCRPGSPSDGIVRVRRLAQAVPGDAPEGGRHQHQALEVDSAARAKRDAAAEGEAREPQGQLTHRPRRVRRHFQQVVRLAATLVVPAFALAHAAEVEAEGRRAGVGEGLRHRGHDLVVHRAAEERVRVRDHGNGHRVRGNRVGDLDDARGALDGGAVRLARGQIFSLSTTRPFTRCSSMISSMSALST